MLIPIQRGEVIPQKLLVKAGLSLTRLILIHRPEAGGIRGQHLINQDQLIIDHAEFKLGIRNDDAALERAFLHDINNLLATLLGTVDRLADEGGEPLLGTTALEGTLEGLTSTDGATAADGRVTVWGLEVRWTLRAETAATGLQLVLSDQPVTLAKLGNRHGVSRERIRQVEKKIIDRFRTYLLAKLPDLERHLYD